MLIILTISFLLAQVGFIVIISKEKSGLPIIINTHVSNTIAENRIDIDEYG